MEKPHVHVTFAEQQTPQPPPPPSLPQITRLIQTVSEAPTGRPRSFWEQFKIFDGDLYWYDTKTDTWQNSGGAGGGVAGSDHQLQFNDGGVFGASDHFRVFPSSGGRSAIVIGDPLVGAVIAVDNATGDLSFAATNYIFGSVIPTTSNDGFLVIPSCGGAPTGTPTFSPAMVFDSVNNKLYVYNGSAWKSVTLT